MLAAIALGANLPSRFGSPEANIREAVRRMTDLGPVIAVSTLHETDPVGYTDQPRFANAAALVSTELDPLSVLRRLLLIEREMGRDRSSDLPPKGPRVIDLDLLLCEDVEGRSVVHSDPQLTLPHPEMHKRRFVLDPLAQIAPAMRHPVLERTVSQLQRQLAQTG